MTANSRPASSPRGGALLKALLILGLLFVLGAAAWTVLLPGIVAATIHSKTGFTVKIDRLSVNPFTANASVGGLVVQNPAGWPEANFVDVRRFKADVQIWPLLAGRFVANEIVADIAAVTLVKNQQGVLNSTLFEDGFALRPAPAGPAKAPAGPPASGGSRGKGFLLHRVELKFDKLVVADYSRRKPLVRTYDLNIDTKMTEVDSVAKLLTPFSGAALAVAADAISGVDPKDADVLRDAVDALQSAGKKAGESLKNIFRSLENKKP